MPRDKGGHGRTGDKAKKAAARREAATQDALRTVSSSAAQAGAVPSLDDELEEAAATFAQTAMSEDEDEADVAAAEAAVPPQPGPSSAERAPASAESSPPPQPPPFKLPRLPSVPPSLSARFSIHVSEDAVERVPCDWFQQLKRSQAVGAAIAAVEELDRLAERQPWPIDEDLSSESGDEEESADSEIEERAEYQAKVYRRAVRRVEKAFPDFKFPGIVWAAGGDAVSLDRACPENSWPCVCAVWCGRMGLWPWQFQPQSHGFCACKVTLAERVDWVKTSLGSYGAKEAFPDLIIGE